MKKLFLTLLIMTSVLFFSHAFADETNYYLIVDAGSTGTRLHFFKHNDDKNMPVIEEIFSEKNSIPLADKAFEAIDPLLQSVVKKIRSHHIKTPVAISILGTAGMRLLPSEQQKNIYQKLSDGISASYKDILEPHHIETISGKMEGIYDWLDVNYLQKNFQNNTPTSGSIDIGGASTQIAFATDKSSKSIDEVSLTLNKVNYIVFSKSFLGLGLDQARESMNIDENAGFCYPKNYNRTGKFDLASCSLIYNQVIENYHIDQLAMPTYKIPSFVAFSGAYYTYHFFGTDPNVPDQDTLEQTIIQPTCSNTWETLKEAYSAEPENYLANYCANSIFVTDLLYGPFRLQSKQIHVLSSINENKIDWALGAMLYTIITREN